MHRPATHGMMIGALLASLLAAAPARAAEPKCLFDVATCLEMFAQTRERPWLGIEFETDSTGVIQVRGVVPGSPAEQSGVKPGDRLRSIAGKEPRDWFAGRGGWEAGARTAFQVLRDGKPTNLQFENRRMPEEMLARIIGVHMIEGHLAHSNHDHPEASR